jgi:hypothetical protein
MEEVINFGAPPPLCSSECSGFLLGRRNGAQTTVPMMGYWSEVYVREGEGWQIRVSTFVSKTPLPAMTAETN